MTVAGWLFMSVSLTLVWGLAVFCYGRVLRGDENAAGTDAGDRSARR